MPKKWAEDTRGLKAKAQKSASRAAKAEKAAAAQAKAEDEAWAQGANHRASRKAEAAARKAAEREARKAEKASLEAKEDAELASMKGVRKRGTKTGGLSKVAAKRAARAELAALQAALAADGGASTEWATGIDAALAATAAPKKASEVVERHPERRQKAAYKAWEPSAMAALKEEQPGLRRTQYKERLAALWRKAPENPMNSETKVAYNAKVDDTAGSEK